MVFFKQDLPGEDREPQYDALLEMLRRGPVRRGVNSYGMMTLQELWHTESAEISFSLCFFDVFWYCTICRKLSHPNWPFAKCDENDNQKLQIDMHLAQGTDPSRCSAADGGHALELLLKCRCSRVHFHPVLPLALDLVFGYGFRVGICENFHSQQYTQLWWYLALTFIPESYRLCKTSPSSIH